MKKKIAALMALGSCFCSFATDFKLTETEDRILVANAGKTCSVLKKPTPSWKGYAIFRMGEASEKNTFGVHVGLQSLPGALLPNGSGARFKVVENGPEYKIIHAEYPLSRENRHGETLKEVRLAVDFYFMNGVAGAALDIAAAATGEKIVVSWLSGEFSSRFTTFAKPGGPWTDLPEKGWVGTGGNSVFCGKNGTFFFLSPSTEFSNSRGVAIVSEKARGKYRKAPLDPGEKLVMKCIIGQVNEASRKEDAEKLLAFRENVDRLSGKPEPESENAPAELKSHPAGKAIRIGSFDGWDGIPLLAERNQMSDLRPQASGSLWHGPDTLSFKAWSAFDKEYLYLRIKVRDKDFIQPGAGMQIWNGDCIQIAFDPLCEKQLTRNYIELGVSPTAKTTVCGWRHPDGKYIGDDISQIVRCAAKRDPKGYECEMAIPWAYLAPFELSRGKIGFNIVVINDGNTWMGITDGIAGGKNPDLYKELYFTAPETVLKTTLEKDNPKLHFPSDILLGEEPIRFSASVYPAQKENPGELTVAFNGGPVLKKELTGSFNVIPFELKPGTLKPGICEVRTALLRAGKTIRESKSSTLVLDRDYLNGFLKETESQLKALSGKIAEIRKQKGVDPAYLVSTAAVMRHFADRARFELDRDFSSSGKEKKILQWTRAYIYPRAYNSLRYAVSALKEANSKADRILAGKELALTIPDVPRGIRPDIRDGGFQLAGKEILFFGPNTWDSGDIARKVEGADRWSISEYDLNLIRGSGFNFINVFNQWKHPSGRPMGSLEENRVRRDQFIRELEKDGMFFNTRNTWHGKLPRDPELQQKYMADWTEKFQKKYPSEKLELTSPAHVFTIGSEEFPNLYFQKTLDFESFRKHLENRYQTIGHLNKTLGTNYSAFGDIKKTDVLNPGMKYAYYEYASKLFFDSERKYMQTLRDRAQLPLSTHYSYCNFYADDPLNTFFDPDRLFEIYEAPGLDIGGALEDKTYAFNWSVFTLICDLVRSFHPERPLVNNEGYTILNNASLDIPTQFHYTSMLQPFFHGMNTCSLFCFSLYDQGAFQNGPFTRADSFHVTAKLALDLRRLSGEVSAFRKAAGPFAILYSMPSFSDPMHRTHLLEAYEGCFFSGFPCKFVGDRQILAGKLSDYKILAVPNAQYVPDSVFEKIAQFSRNGGKVLLFGSDSLALDEYGKRVRSRDGIRKSFRTIPSGTPAEYSAAFNAFLNGQKIKPETEVVGRDGKRIFGLEYRSVKGKNGENLLYLINLNKQPVEAAIQGGGNWFDLLENRESPSRFLLNPLEVRFLRKNNGPAQ